MESTIVSRVAIIGVLLLGLSFSACVERSYSVTRSERTYRKEVSRGQGSAVVCHKGKKTLSLPQSAVDAHLKHGDRIGSCRHY